MTVIPLLHPKGHTARYGNTLYGACIQLTAAWDKPAHHFTNFIHQILTNYTMKFLTTPF